MNVDEIAELGRRLRGQIGQVVMGQHYAIELMLCALLAEGHVLLEGVPGTAKTFLSHCFSRSLALDFRRIQFTPDLMPGDVTGTNLFDFNTKAFSLQKGPVFTEILLADEINRTPPKTQSALLEAMQERSVTIDGKTLPLSPNFMVIATQNPVEQEGTYPLPEAQLDRFLIKLFIGYPSPQDEMQMVRVHGARARMPGLDELGIRPMVTGEQLVAARESVRRVQLSESLVHYVVGLVHATRQHPSISWGASPRAACMLATASRALAAVRGMTYVVPDLIKELVGPVLGHRVVLSPTADLEGRTTPQIVSEVVSSVAAPR